MRKRISQTELEEIENSLIDKLKDYLQIASRLFSRVNDPKPVKLTKPLSSFVMDQTWGREYFALYRVYEIIK